MSLAGGAACAVAVTLVCSRRSRSRSGATPTACLYEATVVATVAANVAATGCANDRLSRLLFARLTNVTNRQTDRHVLL